MHSEISPSKLHRVINCPGCIKRCKNIPKTASSSYADEGSAAHYLGAYCLKKGIPARARIGTKITVGEAGNLTQWDVTDEMAEAVQVYLDTINEIRSFGNGEGKETVEVKVPIYKDVEGTPDYSRICGNKLWIVDYKHGKGVNVEPKNNEQLMAYAVGVLNESDPFSEITDIELVIVQPRIIGHPPIKRWSLTDSQLRRWAHEVFIPKVQEAESDNPTMRAGEWCRWCPATQIPQPCEAFIKMAVPSAESMFGSSMIPVENPMLVDTTKLTADQINRVLVFVDMLADYIEAVKQEGYNRLMARDLDAPTEFKLVEGRKANRAWLDEAKVYEAVKTIVPRDEVFEEKIAGPAKIEKAIQKVVGKDKAAQILEPLLKPREAGKPVMVPITDKRKSYNSPEIMFGDDF